MTSIVDLIIFSTFIFTSMFFSNAASSTAPQIPRGGRLLRFNPGLFTWIVRLSNLSAVFLISCVGLERNFVPKKFRGIDSERFPLFRGRKYSFRGIPSSAEEPVLKLGTKRNGTERNGIPRKNMTLTVDIDGLLFISSWKLLQKNKRPFCKRTWLKFIQHSS